MRAIKLGLSISDMDNIEEGMIWDMLVESGNDYEEYDELASQEDFDNF